MFRTVSNLGFRMPYCWGFDSVFATASNLETALNWESGLASGLECLMTWTTVSETPYC